MEFNVQFVQATNADIQDLIEIQNQAFHDDYIKYGECPGYGRTYENMKRSIENCFVYKIMVDGNIVGDIIVRDNHDDTYFLGGLCVIPVYENNGIGHKAMKFLEQQFKGAHQWSLETPADKRQNHHFYKKCGFHITREYYVGIVKIVLFEKIFRITRDTPRGACADGKAPTDKRRYMCSHLLWNNNRIR